MLVERYLKKQLALSSATLPGIDLQTLRQLASLREVVCTLPVLFSTGNPVVSRFLAMEDQKAATKEKVVSLAASLAAASLSPIFQAVSQLAQDSKVQAATVQASLAKGGWVEGKINGADYFLGDRAAVQFYSLELGRAARALVDQLQAEGASPLFLGEAKSPKLLAIFGCSNLLRSEAVSVARSLQKLKIELILLLREGEQADPHLLADHGIGLCQLTGTVAEQHKQLESLGSLRVPAAFLTLNEKDELPPYSFPIVLSEKEKTGGLHLRQLVELPLRIEAARAMITKARRKFFWARL